MLDTQAHSRVAGNMRPADPLEVVESWHNDTHPGVFRFCAEQPCRSLNVGVAW